MELIVFIWIPRPPNRNVELLLLRPVPHPKLHLLNFHRRQCISNPVKIILISASATTAPTTRNAWHSEWLSLEKLKISWSSSFYISRSSGRIELLSCGREVDHTFKTTHSTLEAVQQLRKCWNRSVQYFFFGQLTKEMVEQISKISWEGLATQCNSAQKGWPCKLQIAKVNRSSSFFDKWCHFQSNSTKWIYEKESFIKHKKLTQVLPLDSWEI